MSRKMSLYERALDRVLVTLERHADNIARRAWAKQNTALTQRISAYTS